MHQGQWRWCAAWWWGARQRGKEHAYAYVYADALAATMGGSTCEDVCSMRSMQSRRIMCINVGEWVAGFYLFFFFFLGGGHKQMRIQLWHHLNEARRY